MKKIIFTFAVNLLVCKSFSQLKVVTTGFVGVQTSVPLEELQIGDRWTFYNGGSKYIGYNIYYTGAGGASKRIFAGPASAIGFNSGTGDINFAFANSGTAGSVANEKVSLNLGATPCDIGIRLDNTGGVSATDYQASLHPVTPNKCNLGTSLLLEANVC